MSIHSHSRPFVSIRAHSRPFVPSYSHSCPFTSVCAYLRLFACICFKRIKYRMHSAICTYPSMETLTYECDNALKACFMLANIDVLLRQSAAKRDVGYIANRSADMM